MRPERIEMVGFAPFRTPTVVDLGGLELFALTGPTGAGKSSVIDAVVFALYGVVPRYDDRRKVEPVISLGMAEARVLVEFSLGGKRYTVARVVRRTPRGGATTAEARLEQDGRSLASGADEVTRAVEALLGLGAAHFTRSVVLPQGQFAAFLHDRPSGQQDLVKALLDLGVLDGMRTRAGERARVADARREAAEARLAALADFDEAAEQEAAARVEKLVAVAAEVEAVEARLGKENEELEAARRQFDLLERNRAVLEEVARPEGVGDLVARAAAARESAAQATAAVKGLTAEEETALERQEALPTLDRLRQIEDKERHLQLAIENRDRTDPSRLDTARAEAEARVAGAEAELIAAEAHLEEVRRSHQAHDLVAGLGEGDPCPVCGQALPTDPDPPPSSLADATERLTRARQAHSEAQSELARIRDERTALEARYSDAVATITELEGELDGAPTGEKRKRLVAERTAADEAVAGIRARLREARALEAEAGAAWGAIEAEEQRSWGELSAARDRLAGLEPPPLPRQDLGAAWGVLLEWVERAAADVADGLAAALLAVTGAERRVAASTDELATLLAAAGVGGTGSPGERLAAEIASARARLEQVRERRQERFQLEDELRRHREAAEVARALELHLRSNRFEGWLLGEALDRLVVGANQLLGELTSGSYSLVLAERNLAVVDHRNADETRSVRSLSGGETFLVSLALALSLGDQISGLSERGAAKLDAIFLDEGFGTLDAETMETVADVVVELSAQGRMVGLVTHVKELAAMIPTRFEVRPGPAGSTIERVEA